MPPENLRPAELQIRQDESLTAESRIADFGCGTGGQTMAIAQNLPGKYDKGTLYETGQIPVHIFDGMKIDLKEIF